MFSQFPLCACVFACMRRPTHPEPVTSLLSAQHHHWSSLHHNDLYRPRLRHICGSLPPFLSLSLFLFLSHFFCLFAFMHFPFGSCQYLALKVNPVHFSHHIQGSSIMLWSSTYFRHLGSQLDSLSRKENCTAHFARTYRMSNMAPIGHDKQTHHSTSASRRRWPLRGRAAASEMKRGGRHAAVSRVSQLSHGVTRASPTTTQLIIHSGWGWGVAPKCDHVLTRRSCACIPPCGCMWRAVTSH